MTTNPDAQRVMLAELLATRLTHDMAGLCGTFQGALELASEDAQATVEALALALDGARDLSRRLQMLRAAWGHTDEALDAPRLLHLAAGLPNLRRLHVDLSELAPGTELPAPLGRLALNALMLGAEALRQGGTLMLSGNARTIEVAILGHGAVWPETLADLLAAPERAWAALAGSGPRGLQAPLLVLLAQAARLQVLLPHGPIGALRIEPRPGSER